MENVVEPHCNKCESKRFDNKRTKPKRFTLKTDCNGMNVEFVEDSDGQWIFDPSHTIKVTNKCT